MNADSLTVTAQIKAKPGKESQVRQELLSLVAPSRKDAGCLNYDLHQALDNHALFLLHENWITEAHLEQHMQQPDVKAVLARLGPGAPDWSPQALKKQPDRSKAGGQIPALDWYATYEDKPQGN